jgi:phage tail tape-measure protein
MNQIALCLLIASTLLLTACGSSEPGRVGGGAAAGAAAGATVGLIGGPIGIAGGALIGGGIGAVTGAATTPNQVNLGAPPNPSHL